MMDGGCNQKMFDKGAFTALRLFNEGLLAPGVTYYGEYLQKPKHNTLCYDRVPKDNIIIFDVPIFYNYCFG